MVLISGSPESLWLIFLPLYLVFWEKNGRGANFAAWGLASVEMEAKTQRAHMKVTSLRRNGVLLDLDPLYSPGKRRNKYVIMIISHSACSTGSPEDEVMLEM